MPRLRSRVRISLPAPKKRPVRSKNIASGWLFFYVFLWAFGAMFVPFGVALLLHFCSRLVNFLSCGFNHLVGNMGIEGKMHSTYLNIILSGVQRGLVVA